MTSCSIIGIHFFPRFHMPSRKWLQRCGNKGKGPKRSIPASATWSRRLPSGQTRTEGSSLLIWRAWEIFRDSWATLEAFLPLLLTRLLGSFSTSGNPLSGLRYRTKEAKNGFREPETFQSCAVDEWSMNWISCRSKPAAKKNLQNSWRSSHTRF